MGNVLELSPKIISSIDLTEFHSVGIYLRISNDGIKWELVTTIQICESQKGKFGVFISGSLQTLLTEKELYSFEERISKCRLPKSQNLLAALKP